MSNISREPMLDMFIFETSQLIEQLEQTILIGEQSSEYSEQVINEVFRAMHTIKGSSAMMLYNDISTVTHSIEDVFYHIRENSPSSVDYSSLTDIVLEVMDYIKIELAKIEEGKEPDGSSKELIEKIKIFLDELTKDNPNKVKKDDQIKGEEKQKYYIGNSTTTDDKEINSYKAVIHFEEGCSMENIRAFTVVHDLKDIASGIHHIPTDIIDSDESIEIIRNEGFTLFFSTDKSFKEMEDFLNGTIFLDRLSLELIANESTIKIDLEKDWTQNADLVKTHSPESYNSKTISTKTNKSMDMIKAAKQSMISVNVSKLDKLMDLVGELVISEAMVTQNKDLEGLELENFTKASRQLGKITSELQDIVMSIRMVTLYSTFMKMNRIVRDMCKKLSKEVELEIIGEETEVDKNIIDQIADPLMHIIRNAIDHGIESCNDRLNSGKSSKGKVILEAKNAGGDVLIIVKDDGRGLNKDKILKKAIENGLTDKEEKDLSDKEIFSFLFLPGFSTNEDVTEYSGRGVGMDVVSKNIQNVGGTVSVDSIEGVGTTIIIKIPLTLAIIGGMNIKVGNNNYTVPTMSIKESFRPKKEEIIIDPDGNEMILIRGVCYPILRIHKVYNIRTDIKNMDEGILIMVENEDKAICLFADELIGEQQVVVKALPKYIKKIKGLAGCTLLGDGNISLILDITGLTNM